MDAASDRVAGLPAEMNCSDSAVAYGGPLFPVHSNVRESVLSTNNDLKCHCAQLQTVNFWRHRGGFWRQPVTLLGQVPRCNLFDSHGVHLTDEGNKVYWRSVHVAVEKGLKMLTKE